MVVDAAASPDDSLEVCAFVAQAQPDMPILIIAAQGDSATVEMALGVGITDFANEPIEWELLALRVSTMIRMTPSVSSTTALSGTGVSVSTKQPAAVRFVVIARRDSPPNRQVTSVRSGGLCARRRSRTVPPDLLRSLMTTPRRGDDAARPPAGT